MSRKVMDMSNENINNQGLLKPGNRKEMMMMRGSNRKFGVEIRHNRRDLGVINQNLVGSQPYPCVIKRALSQTNVSCDKEVENQVNRPITRKLASQIAITKQCHPEETKKAKLSPENFTIWEECTPTDVEEQETTADQPVPMFLETTELIGDNKEEVGEVEMEDIFEETILDIDSCDAKNPLAAVEYIDDIFSHYRKMECCSGVSPDYMTQQSDINDKMRAILIDWLIEVHHKFDLQEETLFLTVNLIDRFLAKQDVVRKKLQLVGLVAMLLACKYEEVSVPVVEDLIFISDRAYSRKEILDMERLMLNTLQFNMSVPTPYVFLTRILKAAESNKKLELLSFFLIELCLVEYETIKFPPSFLAASAIYTAQCSLYGFKQWSKTCQWHSNYSENQLLECSRMIVGYHQKAATGRLTGAYRKYNTLKFDYAAKCEPANFLLVEETSQQQ